MQNEYHSKGALTKMAVGRYKFLCLHSKLTNIEQLCNLHKNGACLESIYFVI